MSIYIRQCTEVPCTPAGNDFCWCYRWHDLERCHEQNRAPHQVLNMEPFEMSPMEPFRGPDQGKYRALGKANSFQCFVISNPDSYRTEAQEILLEST